MKDLSKKKMQLSEAAQILRALKVPSAMINSTDIAQAIVYAIRALDKQIDIGQTIEELKDNPDDADVLDCLNDFYLMSEVNR